MTPHTHCIPYSTSVAVRYLLAFLWLGHIAKASRKSLMAAVSLSWFAQLRMNNKSLKYWMLKLSSNTLIEARTTHLISLVLWWLVFCAHAEVRTLAYQWFVICPWFVLQTQRHTWVDLIDSHLFFQIVRFTPPVTWNILGYSLFCERREKWRVVLRKYQKKKLWPLMKRHFFIHLIW